MVLSPHTIKPAKGSQKNRKRIGRGNASGTGTYSGKGLKGQKSRSGVSNLKRLGMKQMLLRTPKRKGFKSLKPKNKIVSISSLNSNFKDNDTINPGILISKGLIESGAGKVKILGSGKLKLKGIRLSGVLMSETVRKQIDKKDEGENSAMDNQNITKK